MTEYRNDTFDNAAMRCLLLGNLSNPVLLDPYMDKNFLRYLHSDPKRQLWNSYYWLPLRSKPVHSNDQIEWTWLSGVSTSKSLGLFLCIIFRAAVGIPLP